MKTHRFLIYCATFTAFAATGFVTNSGLANAQQAMEEQASGVIEEIVSVEAPIERQQVGPADASGMRTETIALKRQVSYADLDLAKHADVAELEERIESVAAESCEKLEQMYPLPRTPSKSANIRHCTKAAVENSVDGVQAAIAAAQ